MDLNAVAIFIEKQNIILKQIQEYKLRLLSYIIRKIDIAD